MINSKKLIFIISSPRSGSTLLLSFLCGIPNSKILYETKIFSSIYRGNEENSDEVVQKGLKYIANSRSEALASYFDSFEEEIVIEKTPEHCFHLEDIEKLRGLCKRDIHVIYIIRPPVPTVLSLIKASKDNPELFGHIDLLGACEKYEESLTAIYNNLVLKSNKDNINRSYKEFKTQDIAGNWQHDHYITKIDYIPYSICISYRKLIEDPYKLIEELLDSLYIEADIQSLIDNRINNTCKYIPSIVKEKHHANVLRDIKEVEVERRNNITRQINEGFTKRYIERSNYIRGYFEHPKTKETIYDLVVERKVLEVNTYPLVTIIIPLYNKEKYIVDTLTSIFNQTYKNLRVIVIDDASTDNSLEIVEDFRDNLPLDLQIKLCVLHNDNNQGASYTRNEGFSIKGDIYAFCDADDIWDKTLVEKTIKTYKKYPYIDCIYSRVLRDKERNLTEDKSKICNGDVFKDAIKYNFLGCGSNLFVKASVIEKYNLRFDESYSGCEDWDFLIQLSKIATFKCTKEYLVTYRQVEDSLSSNTKNQFDQGRNILGKYTKDKKQYSRLVTRLFFFYLSYRNFTWENIKELDFGFILEIVLDKFKSYVKSYLP